MNRNLDREKRILSQLYSNNSNSINFLLFFFKNSNELRKFFNMFGGKTLVLPDTLEEYLQLCLLTESNINDDIKKCGIDENIHEKTKDKIIDAYMRLFDNLSDVIINECDKK